MDLTERANFALSKVSSSQRVNSVVAPADLHIKSRLKPGKVAFNSAESSNTLDNFFVNKDPLLIFTETYMRNIKQENGLDFKNVLYNL